MVDYYFRDAGWQQVDRTGAKVGVSQLMQFDIT